MSRDESSSAEPQPDLAAALHEVGNGLTVILGWLAQARAHGEATGAVADAVDAALKRAKRAQRIARRAIGADETRLGPERLDSVLAEATLGLTPAASEAEVTILTERPPALAAVHVESPDLLLQVLTNLLLNALEVTPAKHAISLRACSDEGPEHSHLVIEVTDGGPGIPEVDRARLFVRGATTRSGGAGIGLSHARTVALAEGGSLELAPFREGRGATFRLLWPLTTAATRSGPHTVRAHLLGGYRVAVVEDDKQVIELLEMVLGARGATVSSFSDHDAFATALGRESFDVVLLDASPYAPPKGKPGDLERAIGALRRSHPALAVIVISGAVDPGPLGGVTWIRKPFDVEEVVEVVRLVPGAGASAHEHG